MTNKQERKRKFYRGNKPQKKQKYNERVAAATQTATATLDAIKNTQTQVKQIPGFYYDEVQKRYFKIDHRQPYYENHVAKEQQRERTERQKEEKELSQQKDVCINALKCLKMREFNAMSSRCVENNTFRSYLKQCIRKLSENLELQNDIQDMNDVCVSNMCLYDFDRSLIPSSRIRSNSTFFIGSNQQQAQIR
jgi:hypothetical protein